MAKPYFITRLDTVLTLVDGCRVRAFFDRSTEETVAIVNVHSGSYGFTCNAIMHAVYNEGGTIYDRDDEMDFYRAVTGKVYGA